MSQEFNQIIDIISQQDQRYKPDAYSFVMESLSFTQKKFNCFRHVSGEQLLDGIRELLLSKFGPMTLRVLEHWGIHTTEDFGNIVFNLVENKILSKTEDDNIETFRNGYDFQEAFNLGYQKQLEKKISRMRSS